jgi:hypothetical protein
MRRFRYFCQCDGGWQIRCRALPNTVVMPPASELLPMVEPELVE